LISFSSFVILKYSYKFLFLSLKHSWFCMWMKMFMLK